MKKFLVLSLALLSVACSHNMTKEQTTDVFQAIEARDINKAREIHDLNARGNDWEMPNGDTLGYSQFTKTMEEGISYVNFCDSLVTTLSSATDKFASEVGQDEDLSVTEAEDTVSSIEPDFRNKCEFKSQGWERLPIVRIKKLTKVDLFVDHDGTKKKFDDSLTNLKAALIVHNKAIASAEQNRQQAEVEDPTSKSYYVKKMCETAAIISYTKGNIDAENNASQASGVVDKDKLYKNGKSLAINSERLTQVKTEFKTRFGTEWSQSLCSN